MTSNPTSHRTQAERTRSRKQQVIHAAIRFFGQQGYRGARLSDIAKAAGVTGPGLLHHYPDKVQLLMDVLAERDRIDRERFDPSAAGGQGNLLTSLQALVEYNQGVPGLVQLFTVLAAESIDAQHPGHAYFLQRYGNLRDYYIPLIQAGQERGEIRTDLPAAELAAFLIAMMDGLQIQWLYEPGKVDMATTFDQFTRLLKPS